LDNADRWDGVACGHDWEHEPQAAQARVVKDAYGTVLADGDSVAVIKHLKLKGASQILKGGTQVKGIHLAAGDHEISGKIDGSAIGPQACFVKKA